MARATAVLGLVFALLTPAPVLAQHAAAASGAYQISPGDILEIIVWRNKELTMQVTVRPDGWISYPLVNEIPVAGTTVIELQKKLEIALGSVVTTPMVTVMVTRITPLKVSILGKVRTPGRYTVEAPATVLDVLAMAGGPTEYAEPDLMYVLRRGTPDGQYQHIAVRYSSSITAGKSNTNVAISQGDIIVVP
jgi:polysaccharide export outer membrane protein